MEIAIIVLAASVLLATGALFFFRSNQNQLGNGFGLLREQLDSFQRNLLVLQKEFERTQETKDNALRQEISTALANNRQELQVGLRASTDSMEKRVGGMDGRLDTRLKGLTESVNKNLEANLKEGFLHFTKVQEHLQQTEIQLRNLSHVGESINDLNQLLKLPHLRGGFGEATLERLLTDMLPLDGFELQYRVVPSSTERVDAVIKYPKQVLPVDSKFPREQVLPLFETNKPSELEGARKRLAEIMKTLARQIREKYIHPEHGTSDMALLFVPSETLYFEILRNTKLCEDLKRQKVFAVSPNTLAVTLHAISASRNYYEMAKGVEKTLRDVKVARNHFEKFEKRYTDVGSALSKAQTAYFTAATHLSRYSGAVTRLTGGDEPSQELKPSTSETQDSLLPPPT